MIPNVEGTKYSYNSTNGNAVLSPGSSVNENVIVEENCEEGYHKAVPYRFMICSNGNWNPFVSDRLCLSKCAFSTGLFTLSMTVYSETSRSVEKPNYYYE